MRFIGFLSLHAHLSALAGLYGFAFLAGPIGRRPPAADGAAIAADPLDALPSLLLPKTELPAGEAGLSLARVHETLRALLPAGRVAVYEAGGGSVSYLPATLLARADTTVVDLDPVQIANSEYAQTRICADVQRHWLRPESVDLVTCYNVIEHLPDVEAALLRFCDALRPGGLMLIAAPYPRSLSGLVTRFTPHGFHVWFYRHVRGDRHAGEPGQPPFPVHYHPLVSPHRLKGFLGVRGFEPVYERIYESPRYAEMRVRLPALALIADAVTGTMNILLGGRANVRHGDYHLVLRKRAGTPQP